KQYESERRKLDAGLSDIYKVLERQTALMNARSAEIQAQTELNKAIAELQRATGNSLKDNDVETKLVK
ncbi:MAG: TolC family protein, partial [Acidobacteriota bacterium]|nr:TolC family protein [Acidobacteriota bacterium]